MQERDTFEAPRMPIDLVISSMVETKTLGDLSLQEALRFIGYKITVKPGKSEIGILIDPHNNLQEGNTTAKISLSLNRHGIVYYPETDPFIQSDHLKMNMVHQPYKLCSITVDDKLRLEFQGLVNSDNQKTVKLFSRFEREDFPF